MSAEDLLNRLRAALKIRHETLPQGSVLVEHDDLDELLYRFDRLDREYRILDAEHQLLLQHKGHMDMSTITIELDKTEVQEAIAMYLRATKGIEIEKRAIDISTEKKEAGHGMQAGYENRVKITASYKG